MDRTLWMGLSVGSMVCGCPVPSGPRPAKTVILPPGSICSTCKLSTSATRIEPALSRAMGPGAKGNRSLEGVSARAEGARAEAETRNALEARSALDAQTREAKRNNPDLTGQIAGMLDRILQNLTAGTSTFAALQGEVKSSTDLIAELAPMAGEIEAINARVASAAAQAEQTIEITHATERIAEAASACGRPSRSFRETIRGTLLIN